MSIVEFLVAFLAIPVFSNDTDELKRQEFYLSRTIASRVFPDCDITVVDMEVSDESWAAQVTVKKEKAVSFTRHFAKKAGSETCLVSMLTGSETQISIKSLQLDPGDDSSNIIMLVNPMETIHTEDFVDNTKIYSLDLEDGFAIIKDLRTGISTHECTFFGEKDVGCRLTRPLRIVYDSWFPMFIISEDGNHSGVMYDLLLIIAGRLGLKLEMVLNPNRWNWGQPVDGNLSNWTGMIGMVHRGEVDGCAAGVSINHERSRAVDFAISIVRMTFALFTQSPTAEQISWQNYLKEFDAATWICIVMTSLALALALHVCLYATHFREPLQSGYTSMAIIIRSFLAKGFDINAGSISFKAVFFITLLFNAVIWACYKGSMNSFLAVVKPASKVSSMEDILYYTRGLTYWSPNYFEVLWKDSPPDSTLGRLYRNFLNDPTANPHDYSVMIDNVVEDNYVLAGPYQTIRLHPKFDCRLSKMGVDIQSDVHTSFIFTRHSPFAALFNREIIRLKNQGVVDRVLFRYGLRQVEGNGCRESSSALGLTNVFGPFFIVTVGLVAALTLSVLEKLIKRTNMAKT